MDKTVMNDSAINDSTINNSTIKNTDEQNNNYFQSLIDELSDQERPVFEALLARLKDLKGNLDELSDQEQAQLAELVARHNTDSEDDESIKEFIQESPEELSAAETIEVDRAIVTNVTENLRPMETEFGAYLIDCINEHLCKGGASTADAVRYAFHNKWMPENLKNRDVCEDLYYRYIDEIDQANDSLKQSSPSQANEDIVVAVGLAWFTNLFRCYQLVEAEGDL